MAESWEDLVDDGPSWEDLVDEAPKEEPAKVEAPKPAPAPQQPRALSEKQKKKEAFKQKEASEKKQAAKEMTREEVQRMVEENDYRNVTDLYGDLSTAKELETFIPKSEADFKRYAELMAQLTRDFAKNPHYTSFANNLIDSLVEPLKSDDVNNLIKSLTKLKLAKAKKEKEDAAKAKTSNRKKAMIKAQMDNYVDKEEDSEDSEDYGDDYAKYENEYDDYDFM